MKHYFNSLTKSLLGILTLGVLFSCSDTWDDHYTVDQSVVPDQSIIDRLEANPEASNFVKVLKTTCTFNGKKMVDNVTYYDLLGADQFLTVWAPVNSALTAEEWAVYTKENKTREESYEVSQRFIKNHIARFSHPVGTATNEKIIMMSEKRYKSLPDNIDEVAYVSDSKNLPCSNGVLHVLNGYIEYKPNIYEFITTEAEYSEILGKFFAAYTIDEIDEEKSVAAGVVDGQMVYIDSVVNETSILMDKFGIVNSEDSNYVLVIPNGESWKVYYDSIQSAFDFKYQEAADSLQEFWANSAMLTDAFFNMNLQKAPNDSVISTLYDEAEVKTTKKIYHTYYNPYASDGLFSKDVVEVVECSNGLVYKTNGWTFDKAYTYNTELVTEAEASKGRTTSKDASITQRVFRSTAALKVSEDNFLELKGQALTSNWNATFSIYNNVSGYYNAYAVILPNDITGSYTLKPNKFTATISTYDDDGRIVQYQQVDKRGRALALSNDGSKADSVLLYENVYIPACNYEQENANVKVQLAIKMTSSETKKFSNTMFLDCIVLVPVEAPESTEDESGDATE